MKKVQRRWSDVAKELNEQLFQSKLSHEELASASGVSYYAIRRFRLSGVLNQSANSRKLCIFFNINTDIDVKVQPDQFAKLVSELASVWDGSESHAKLLAKLIRSTKSFRVEGRKDL
ncbi:MAG: hypothetical protein KKG03_03460 [Gammaproteobacteria bacterium]|nr:hypothetical protein [Sideroxydans sp.]MBU4150690.1 hypothetical protein [Gammaproteobacteria bacterium]